MREHADTAYGLMGFMWVALATVFAWDGVAVPAILCLAVAMLLTVAVDLGKRIDALKPDVVELKEGKLMRVPECDCDLCVDFRDTVARENADFYADVR